MRVVVLVRFFFFAGKPSGNEHRFSAAADRGVERGGEEREGVIHTCIISFLTFGTSEKKNNANTPATMPNEAAVIPLFIFTIRV